MIVQKITKLASGTYFRWVCSDHHGKDRLGVTVPTVGPHWPIKLTVLTNSHCVLTAMVRAYQLEVTTTVQSTHTGRFYVAHSNYHDALAAGPSRGSK